MASKPKTLTDGQRAYEERRAKRAGMSLDRWMAEKDKQLRAEERAARKAEPKPAKPPGFFSRLLDKAHKPLS